MNPEVFKNCKNKRLLYFTTDEDDIKDALVLEVNRSLKLCWTVAKEMAAKGETARLVDYLSRIDPFTTEHSEFNEGFLREPGNKKELDESEWHCLAVPYEPLPLAEADDGCQCEGDEE